MTTTAPAEWIDRWIDRYLEAHPNERIDDFESLRELADREWYDNEVNHDHKTALDLTPEQEKVAQEMRKGARAVNAYGKTVKRERKPNEDKREIIQTLDEALCDLVDNVTISNIERQIDFEYNGTQYSVTLTAHRPAKK